MSLTIIHHFFHHDFPKTKQNKTKHVLFRMAPAEVSEVSSLSEVPGTRQSSTKLSNPALAKTPSFNCRSNETTYEDGWPGPRPGSKRAHILT